MKDPDNIRLVCELQPDFMGFIFYSGSPRYFEGTDDPFSHTDVQGTEKVGVFVNETVESVLYKIGRYKLDMVQLHGNETPEYCSTIKRAGIPIIKAACINNHKDLENLSVFENHCDYFLFDKGGQKFGGTGEKFSWEILKSYTMHIPFFLSGGIGPDDAGIIKELNHPGLFAVDINSRFEISPGMKDVSLVKTFIKSIRQQI